ncbi:MAG: hypothetical protein ACRDZQ_02870, partial [Acidimicrobiales bacterium]
FAGDSGPGQAKGQGLDTFGGGWAAVTAAGRAAGSGVPPASSTPSTAATSGGYGYATPPATSPPAPATTQPAPKASGIPQGNGGDGDGDNNGGPSDGDGNL